MASPEHVLWAIEDIQRLILPQLDVLHTAQDLWNWRCRPEQNETYFPGFADRQRARAWLESKRNSLLQLQDFFYAARVLADESFDPLVRAWEAALQVAAEKYPGAANGLRYVTAFRELPQTPMDAPL